MTGGAKHSGYRVLRTIKRIAAVGAAAAIAASAGLAALDALVKTGAPFVKEGKFDAYVVIGEKAKPIDVVAAVDLVAALMTKAKEVTPAGKGEVVVEKKVGLTEAVDLYTADKKLYLKDSLDKAVDMISKEKLPTILADGKVVDADGKEYPYKQYIVIEGTQADIQFVQPESDKPPVIALDLSGGELVYKLKVVFDKPVNLTKAIGKEFRLFGKTFYIGHEVKEGTLVLYGAAEELPLVVGETKEVEVGGEKYTIKLVGASSTTDKAVIEVNGEKKEVYEGKAYTIGGLEVYVKEVWSYDIPEKSAGVTLLIGSKKYEFKDGKVYVGGEELEGVSYEETYNVEEFGGLTIDVKLPAEKKYIKVGEEFVDPLFGTFKLLFKGPSVDLKGAEKDKIVVGYTGDDKVYLHFVDAEGREKDVVFAKLNTTSGEISFTDEDGVPYIVKEGVPLTISATAGETKTYYTVLYPGDAKEAKLVKVSIYTAAVNDSTPSKVKVTVEDVVTGAKYLEKEYTADTTEDFTVGLKTYKIHVNLTNKKVELYYGTEGDVDFPALAGRNGELIYLYAVGDGTAKSVAADTNGEITVTAPAACGTDWVAWFDVNGTAMKVTSAAEKLTNLTANATYTVKLINATCAGAFTVGEETLTAYPAVKVVEEEESGEWVARASKVGSGPYKSDVEVKVPDGVESASVEKTTYYLDVWGTYAEKVDDSEGRTALTLYYPDEKVWYDVKLASTEAAVKTEEVTYKVGDEIPGVGTIKEIKGVVEGKVYAKPDVALPVAYLDTDSAWRSYTKPIIAVGGPAVNSLVAEMAAANATKPLEWYRTPEMDNKALIQLVDDYKGVAVLIVAGKEGKDTLAAARWLADLIKAGEEHPDFAKIEGKAAVIYDTATGAVSELKE